MLLWCCYGVVIMIKEYYDENKIKSAFFNVKKDILEIKNEIEEIKRLLLKKEEKITNNKNNSTGNDGVVIMPLLSRYYDVVMPRKESDHKIEVKDLKILDKEIKSFIISLTDKEFLIFLAIYQLEDELNRPVTYEDLSKKLKISLFSLRNRIGGLILKGAPINKEKLHNYKAMFSIKQGFRDLKIIDKLLDLRRNFESQTHLSNDFGV